MTKQGLCQRWLITSKYIKPMYYNQKLMGKAIWLNQEMWKRHLLLGHPVFVFFYSGNCNQSFPLGMHLLLSSQPMSIGWGSTQLKGGACTLWQSQSAHYITLGIMILWVRSKSMALPKPVRGNKIFSGTLRTPITSAIPGFEAKCMSLGVAAAYCVATGGDSVRATRSWWYNLGPYMKLASSRLYPEHFQLQKPMCSLFA